MNMDTMLFIWLGIVIVTLVIEIITQGLTTIWFSIGGAVSALLTIWDVPVWIQIAVFAGVSILIMLLVRPVAKRIMSPSITPTNIDQLIREEGFVLEEIDNSRETGKVRLRGIEWMARSADGEIIPAGVNVSIKSIEGVKLIVKGK
ncbi:MAG: NfeD family protein [Eubacterium sp.]|nr:NfeD family protein [Eubacterium sp.]